MKLLCLASYTFPGSQADCTSSFEWQRLWIQGRWLSVGHLDGLDYDERSPFQHGNHTLVQCRWILLLTMKAVREHQAVISNEVNKNLKGHKYNSLIYGTCTIVTFHYRYLKTSCNKKSHGWRTISS